MIAAGPLRRSGLIAALCLSGLPAQAHQLVVFAKVEDRTVLIDARFANGTPVAAGKLRILDATGTLIHEQLVSPPYPVRFPVGIQTDGLRIEVDAGHGHENYWLLTPHDLSQDTFGQGKFRH